MEQTLSANNPWPLAQKLAFRFFFIFFILFIFFNPNGAVPLLNFVFDRYIQPMHQLMIWCGAHIFHLGKPITEFTGGSGDTTYDYLVWLFCAVVALLGTLIWSGVNRRPCNYDKLYYWLLVIVRFYLGITLVSYGAVKVIKLQFPYPRPSRLLQAYGDSSPMGLAWTFMGYSKGYNYFTGMAELSCGLLLLFRKTSTLGAIIALVVSANIMAINYCFDVPVKIVSTMMVVMSVFILAKDFNRFVSFFFLNKPTEPANLKPKRFKKKWQNITLVSIKYLLIFYVAASTIDNCIQGAKQYGDEAPKPSLFGIFNTETFKRNNAVIAPLTTDTTRWRRLVIGSNGYARVFLMNDSTRTYNFNTDTVAKKVIMFKSTDTLHKFTFNYNVPKPGVLVMKGVVFADTLQIVFNRYSEKDFLLMKRGFHWVNEAPFNR